MTNVIRFTGICDGSAVVKLPNNNLLLAYDEQNSLFEFAPVGGGSLREYDYGVALGIEQEVDVEAAVMTGQHIWWLGSHGNDGSGKPAPARQQLFKTAVNVSATNRTRVEVTGNPLNLLPALLGSGLSEGLIDASQLTMKPKKGGINIEGLSIMENGHLLLGLRSPLSAGTTGEAIVARVDVSGGQPAVMQFYTLDLGDRGIRDMHLSAAGYLLIAGEVASGGDFSIYRWVPGANPVWVLDLPDHFNAEALVDTGEHWLVVSDDGKVKRSDESAADGDRRCDSIRRKNPVGNKHPSVFFRALGYNLDALP